MPGPHKTARAADSEAPIVKTRCGAQCAAGMWPRPGSHDGARTGAAVRSLDPERAEQQSSRRCGHGGPGRGAVPTRLPGLARKAGEASRLDTFYCQHGEGPRATEQVRAKIRS